MHPRLCVPALLLAGLWLGSSSEPATAQLPGKETNVVYVGVTREVRMSENQFIKAVRSDNPKVATVVLRKDDPRVALVTGFMEGIARITLTDMKDKTEELVITVTTAQAEQQFLLLQRMAEQRRAALEKMIKDTVPTANVQVLVFGWTVVLKGTILTAEDGQFILEMSRSVCTEFQDPNSLTNPAAAARQPTPYGP